MGTKRFLIALVAMLLPLMAIADASGACGKKGSSVSWYYSSETHTLTISGNGYMEDYPYPHSYGGDHSDLVDAPWKYLRGQIVNIIIENGVFNIGKEAFFNCSGLTSVTIPNSVTSIGGSAFSGCSGLTSVTIPNSVTSIGETAFSGCSGLTTIKVEEGNTVYDSRKSCNAIIKSSDNELIVGCMGTSIPNSVTSIGGSAFSGCSGLTSVTIPNSVTSIGGSAFSGCNGLTSVTIPNSVTSIGIYAFSGCSGLTSVTIPNSVTSINWSAFSGSGLTSVTIPNSVTSIGQHAFYGCNGLTSVTIPNSVTSIGIYAFYGCSGLTSVTIPNSVASIGESAFSGCSGLTSVTIGNSVKSIGSYAFYGCSGLTSVTIPTSVTSIGSYTFYGCSGLTSVICLCCPTSIGENVFSRCTSDVKFDCETVTSLFKGNTSITKITMTDKVNTIDNSAFSGCSGLTTVTIPSSVTSIGNSAFSGCSGLTSLIVNCKIVDAWFKGLSTVKEIILSEGVVSVADEAFNGCKAITSIELPSTITEIGQRAFANIDNLTDVFCLAKEVPNTNRTAFENSYIDYATLHVSEESTEAYKTTGPWSGFKSIVAGVPTYTLTYMVDGVIYKSTRHEEGESIIPEETLTKEGYTFSGWSEIPQTMPAQNVTVTGSFTVNKYELTYIVDGEQYKSYGMEYGTAITPEAVPIKDGYIFSGWSEVPKTMPAHDVTVTGTFTVDNNKYTLTYMVDGEVYKIYEIKYGSTIIPESEPIKEGYTFSGWSEIPQTMPAQNVTVTGSFSVNKYELTYIVDGEQYKSYEMEYGTIITPEPVPTKEGYTFSGWSEIPESMPAEDVTVTGSFTVAKYKLTYMVDGEEYKSYEMKYGSTIIPESEPIKEGYTFSGWSEIPEEMPANDVAITGTFTKIPVEEPQLTAPAISLVKGKLVFTCDEAGVTYHYGISTPDIQGDGNDVELSHSYRVSVYASKEGFQDSETVTKDIVIKNGDVNLDGKVDVSDHVELTSIIMAGQNE